jgi:hypothetical protein
MSSYSSKLAADLRQAFESIKFFDPSRIQQVADANSQPYLPAAARLRSESTPDVNIAELDGGKLRGNLYDNSSLGFSYRFPEDWVRSTLAHLQPPVQTSDAAALSSGSESTATPDQCVRILVSFTQHYDQDRRLDFNPRVTILAANPNCFIPDMTFPASLQDNETMKRYGHALVHSLVGTRLIGRGEIKLFGIDLNGHIFVEIASSNAESVAGSALLRKIHSHMILTTMSNTWIIWLFESDAEADFGTVLKSSVSFDATR